MDLRIEPYLKPELGPVSDLPALEPGLASGWPEEPSRSEYD